MEPFAYQKASNLSDCLNLAAKNKEALFVAGGTTIVDLLKLQVLSPNELVDINGLGLRNIERKGNSYFIGALVSNSELARNAEIAGEFPVLSQSILAGASAQLRNMASVGGNIMQKTRCYYYRDPAFPCNKREPGSGCPALEGFNRIHAVLGGSTSCVAVHGSDMCVALAALDAVIHTEGPEGKRQIKITDFHLEPGATPDKESVLKQAELITHVELPISSFSKRSHYLKVRDRSSYAFSLSSAAVALDIRDGLIKDCRIALGGVATKPWRVPAAEAELMNRKASEEVFKKAAEKALQGAAGLKFNSFKIELTKRTILRALNTAGAIS